MEIPPSCLLTSPCTLNSAEPCSRTSFPSAVRTNLEWLFSCINMCHCKSYMLAKGMAEGFVGVTVAVVFTHLSNYHLIGLQALDRADDGHVVVSRCRSKRLRVLNDAILVQHLQQVLLYSCHIAVCMLLRYYTHIHYSGARMLDCTLCNALVIDVLRCTIYHYRLETLRSPTIGIGSTGW